MMRQPELRCVEFVEQVTAWLDGGLSDDEVLLFEEHLAYCGPCIRYVDQFRQTLALVRHSGERLSQGPPPAVRDALLRAFRQQRDRSAGEP